MEKKVKIRIAFYIVAAISVLMFIAAFALQEYFGDSVISEISRNYNIPNISLVLIVGALCIWTWLSIIGLLFIPKNRIVILISLLFLLPNILILVLSYGFSYSPLHIAKMYIFILSFGMIVI